MSWIWVGLGLLEGEMPYRCHPLDVYDEAETAAKALACFGRNLGVIGALEVVRRLGYEGWDAPWDSPEPWGDL